MRLVEALTLPVEAAQAQEQQPFFGSGLGGFGAPRFVGCDGGSGVAQGKVDVADGVVKLVEVVLVAAVARHLLEARNHSFRTLGSGEGFRLEDARMEHHGVVGAAVDALLKGGIGFGFAVERHVDLPEQIGKAGAAVTAGSTAGSALQVGHCLVQPLLTDEKIGHREVAFPTETAREFRGARLVEALEGIFGIVIPFEFGITTCQPDARFGHHHGFGGVEARDVSKGRSRGHKLALLKLRTPHQQPRIFEERIELLAREIGPLAFRLTAIEVGLRFGFDAVELDGFFALGDGQVEVVSPEGTHLFIAHAKHRQAFRVVFAQATALRLLALLVGLCGVVVHVVAGDKSLPPARGCGVLLGRTSREQPYDEDEKEKNVFDKQWKRGEIRCATPLSKITRHEAFYCSGSEVDHHAHHDDGCSRGHVE